MVKLLTLNNIYKDLNIFAPEEEISKIEDSINNVLKWNPELMSDKEVIILNSRYINNSFSYLFLSVLLEIDINEIYTFERNAKSKLINLIKYKLPIVCNDEKNELVSLAKFYTSLSNKDNYSPYEEETCTKLKINGLYQIYNYTNYSSIELESVKDYFSTPVNGINVYDVLKNNNILYIEELIRFTKIDLQNIFQDDDDIINYLMKVLHHLGYSFVFEKNDKIHSINKKIDKTQYILDMKKEQYKKIGDEIISLQEDLNRLYFNLYQESDNSKQRKLNK